MKVVVLLSSYNGERYIKEQIDSIINQTYNDISLIVRDDGSSDKTCEILESYGEKIRWYSGANIKPAHSFMDLLYNCGEYDFYAFSDQDDIWDKDKIEVAINALKDIDKPALYYCNSELMDSQGMLFNQLTYKNGSDEIKEQDNVFNSICCGGAMGCTMVLNCTLVEMIRKRDIPKQMIMHDSYIQSVCAAIDGKIIFDEKAHMRYRQHELNVVGRKPGIINALLYRWNYLTQKKEVSIADQAKYILENFDSESVLENRALHIISEYKNSILKTICLAMSNKFSFNSLRDSMFIRMSILLRKR